MTDYQCGYDKEWSQVISFKTPSNETSWSPRLLVLGDLGLQNGASYPFIKKDIEIGNVDMIFHNGNIYCFNILNILII